MADKKRYGKYEVRGRLGVGGMGVVYKGYDSLIDRHVAIKTMSLDKARDENLKQRFYREAQSAGMLNHQNIVTIFDMDEEEGQPYIAMELLSGVDLKEIIAKRMPLSIEQKVDIVAQACDGLAYAHRHGIVHRDIKPGNIRLLDKGLVKILDFGIARIESSELTKTGMVMGTVSYMSPEQIAGKKVDGRSDVFSLGVVFYELLTGRKPFPGEAITTIIYKIMNEAPDRKHDDDLLPAPVERIIKKALKKDLVERYQSADEMAEDLRAFLSSLREQDDTLSDMEVGGATMMVDRTVRAEPAPPARTAAREATPPGSRTAVPTQVPLMPKPETSPPASAPPPAPAPTPAPPRREAKVPKAPPRARPVPPPPPATPPPSPPAAPPVPSVARPQPVPAGPPDASTLADLSAEAARVRPEPEPGRGLLIGAAIVGILLVVSILVMGWWLLTQGSPAVAPQGYVSLDVRPWADVSEVTNIETGDVLDVGSPVTPCRLELAPGRYRITLANAQFGDPLTLEVEVASGGTQVVSRELSGFDLEAVVDSL